MLFTQASFISVGIFLGVGIAQVIYHLMGDEYAPEWYFSLSVILAGIICSLPSLILCVENFKTYLIAVHFGILLIAVSLLGFLFKWYTNLIGYFIVMGIFGFIGSHKIMFIKTTFKTHYCSLILYIFVHKEIFYYFQ